MTDSDNPPTSQELREHAVGLYDALDTPLRAIKDLADELKARPEQGDREQRTAGNIQTAAVHLAQARQALLNATQEWATGA